MDTVVRAREKPAILAASRKFDGFRRELLHDVRTAAVKSSPVLDEMTRIWKQCTQEYLIAYDTMLGRIRGLEYSAKDVELFSLELARFQNDIDFTNNIGHFLSALINNCQDKDFVIHTTHLSRPIPYLGHHNTKNITVEGGVGSCTGHRMEGGSITVRGDAGDDVGNFMKAGIITVEGDAGERIGGCMQGGELRVNNHRGISKFARGNILIRGVQLS